MDARKKRLLGILACLVLLAVGLGLLALELDVGAYAKRCLEFVRAEGAVLFFFAMAVLPLFGFPLSPFVLSAGPVFGPTLGTTGVIACGVAAIAVNVSIAYWVGSFALRPWMERFIAWLGYDVPKLPTGKDWELTFILRIVPGVPFFLQSYLLGLARVRFWKYLIVSTLVPSGYLVAAVVAGDALVHGDKRKLILGGVLFAVVGGCLHFLRKRYAARKRGAGSE